MKTSKKYRALVFIGVLLPMVIICAFTFLIGPALLSERQASQIGNTLGFWFIIYLTVVVGVVVVREMRADMRKLGAILCIAGCVWLAYHTLTFPRDVNFAIESRVHDIERYDARLTQAQAITQFRELGQEIMPISRRIWPRLVLVLLGTVLSFWPPPRAQRRDA